ncbi:hypothetical protein EGH22_19130 [Halomicroarcula sp. F28]|uniref:hypothetical protein n=1 Tax=Haloarcula salinisoli TaxID=2487746 RepID=UPI001C735B24|nr:hypothetical protein [Halomicroarcula salinisoli]MBX0288449.1 hypothetical protein [Halomicroarcula salinisoli]
MPTFDNYEFDRGDYVEVDWRDGQGSLDTVAGTVTGISESSGEVIVSVEADDDQCPEGSIYGGTHDCAPAWISRC